MNRMTAMVATAAGLAERIGTAFRWLSPTMARLTVASSVGSRPNGKWTSSVPARISGSLASCSADAKAALAP